jgi:hypothetical protein
MIIIFSSFKYHLPRFMGIHPEVKPVRGNMKKVLRILEKDKSFSPGYGKGS